MLQMIRNLVLLLICELYLDSVVILKKKLESKKFDFKNETFK
jgi:hypothetical protein